MADDGEDTHVRHYGGVERSSEASKDQAKARVIAKREVISWKGSYFLRDCLTNNSASAEIVGLDVSPL